MSKIRDAVFWRCPLCNRYADKHGTYSCDACWEPLSNDERIAVIYRLYPVLSAQDLLDTAVFGDR